MQTSLVGFSLEPSLPKVHANFPVSAYKTFLYRKHPVSSRMPQTGHLSCLSHEFQVNSVSYERSLWVTFTNNVLWMCSAAKIKKVKQQSNNLRRLLPLYPDRQRQRGLLLLLHLLLHRYIFFSGGLLERRKPSNPLFPRT